MKIRDFTFYTEGSTNGVAIHSNDERLIFMGAAASSGSGVDTGYFQIENGGSATIALNSNGVSYLNGGNVGIGTTSPSYEMHIQKAASETSLAIQSNISPTGSSVGGRLRLQLGAQSNSGSGNADTSAGDFCGQVLFEGQGTDYSYQAGSVNCLVTTGDGDDGRANQGAALTFGTMAVAATSQVEKMRLTEDGRLGIGTTSPGAKLEVSGKDDYGAGDLLRLQFDNSPADTGITFTDINSTVKNRISMDAANTADLRISSGTQMHFYGGTTDGTGNGHLMINSSGHVGIVAAKRFYLDNASIGNGDTYIDEYAANEVGITTGGSRKLAVSGGNLYVSGSVNANHNFSDERLKENIVVIPNALEKVSSLRGITFKRKADGSVGTGLIAQELEAVLPEAVYEAKSIESLEDSDAVEYKGIRYETTVGLLVEAIKELEARVKVLEG